MKRLIGTVLAVLLVPVALGVLSGMTAERPPAETFFLELEGKLTGFIKSADGGQITSDVVTEKSGSDLIVHKHLGSVKYEDLTIVAGIGDAEGFDNWLRDTLDHKFSRKNGSITGGDFTMKARQTREFHDALITEIRFPALDSSSKDAAPLTVKIQPMLTRSVPPIVVPQPPPPRRHHPFIASNFRLEIDGLDCSRVAKIDAFTVKQGVVPNVIGEDRGNGVETSSLEIPNLRITIATDSAPTWEAWFDDFVLKGNNGDDREKKGSLIFLDPTRQKELLRLNLKNLGIFGLHPPVPPKPCCDTCVPLIPPPADPVGLRHLVAELYCEAMQAVFQPPAGE